MQEFFKNYINNYPNNRNQKNECNCVESPQNPPDENVQENPNTDEFANCNQCVVEKIGYAKAFVPYQYDSEIMSENQSFLSGTIFNVLSMPYEKGSALMRFDIKE